MKRKIAVALAAAVVLAVVGGIAIQADEFTKQLGDTLTAAGYPAKADDAQINKPMVIALLAYLVLRFRKRGVSGSALDDLAGIEM